MTITFHQGAISHSLLCSNHFYINFIQNQFYIFYIEAFECQHTVLIKDQAAEVCYLEVESNSNHIKNSICQIFTFLEKCSDHKLKFWSLLIWPFLPEKKDACKNSMYLLCKTYVMIYSNQHLTQVIRLDKKQYFFRKQREINSAQLFNILLNPTLESREVIIQIGSCVPSDWSKRSVLSEYKTQKKCGLLFFNHITSMS